MKIDESQKFREVVLILKIDDFLFFFIFTTFWRFQHMLCIRFNVRWKALTLKNIFNTKYNAKKSKKSF